MMQNRQTRWYGPAPMLPADPPADLCAHQKTSFQRFLTHGIGELLADMGPITAPSTHSGHAGQYTLTLSAPAVGSPPRSAAECRSHGLTYSAPVRVRAALRVAATGEIVEKEVLLCDLPIMTEEASFVINGADRVIIGQLGRSPGLYLTRQPALDGLQARYGLTLIPARGALLGIEMTASGRLIATVGRARRVPLGLALRALLCMVPAAERETAAGRLAALDAAYAPVLTESEARQTRMRPASDPVLDLARRLRPHDALPPDDAAGLVSSLYTDPRRYDLGAAGRFLLDRRLGRAAAGGGRTLCYDDILAAVALLLSAITAATQGAAVPPDDMDHLGNRRVRLVGDLVQDELRAGLLRLERRAGEVLSLCTPRTVAAAPPTLTPERLITARPVTAALRAFFAASPLSQLVDRTNPLAELTHKRRLTVQGPGGLSRQQAGSAVRDVHRSHYGRICPIETPEGQNIALVLSLATDARINPLGFIEAPYRRVLSTLNTHDPGLVGRMLAADLALPGGPTLPAGARIEGETAALLRAAPPRPVRVRPFVSDEIVYQTADVDDHCIIAQGSTPLDADRQFVEDVITVRRHGVVDTAHPDEVDLIDLSPRQFVSPTTALIPYLEHDEPHRALMGSNMQRQAVPTIRPAAPLVGTGMERVVARDSGHLVRARAPGRVICASGREIVVRTQDGRDHHYPLRLYEPIGDGGCFSQRPAVRRGQDVAPGAVLADCMASVDGELALGQNVLVAFLTFKGANYEDAIVISDRLVQEDVYTSIHLETYTCDVRATEHGDEALTNAVPNASRAERRFLGEDGLVRTGALVGPHDILVGKVTPRPRVTRGAASPEQRLLAAVLGTRSSAPRDTSLRVPHGMRGTVVEVRVETAETGARLPRNVLCRVSVVLAQKRKLSEGDKMAGRHGNKGVVARILPRADMPFLPDGTPVDMVLSAVGVPSRMNIGQVHEAHLGWAARALGYAVACPVFAGLPEDDYRAALARAGLPTDGKTILYDGETGEPFDQPVAVGVAYMLKLHHLVDDKVHARATGPHALITQQPVGGRARGGGQRIGEMERWALEAYGAATVLHEMMTVKSDSPARDDVYHALLTGKPAPDFGTPAAFTVLGRELAALGLDLASTGDGGLRLALAGPTAIRAWSHGEVTRHDTIDARTGLPVAGGLFDPAIFGPTRDYHCQCGRYTGDAAASEGVAACPDCGTPLTTADARRLRLGHIELACPVAHPLFAHGRPSVLALLLDVTPRALAAVLSCTAAIVTHVDDGRRSGALVQLSVGAGDGSQERMLCHRVARLAVGQILDDQDLASLQGRFPGLVRAGTGAGAVRAVLEGLDLSTLAAQLATHCETSELASGRRRALLRRWRVVRDLRRGGVRPEWMVLSVLPVLPPDLRPIVPMQDGRIASSDLNDLYGRVVQRNARVRRLVQLRAPELILRNERRLLQEAVDALFLNRIGGTGAAGPATTKTGRPLTSLAARLVKKDGRFRRNLLGKRVDFSGRSIIVAGPDLALHQCGLPRSLALTLFHPLVVRALRERNPALAVRQARRLVDRTARAVTDDAVWEALAHAMQGRVVLLNRAPTLHRLGLQAFEPVLVEGRAIQLHPLVCGAFNADFDGDQMAVHLPLTERAQLEARTLMLSTRNLLSPASGEPAMAPAKDIALGCYYLTRDPDPCREPGPPALYEDVDAAVRAYETGRIGLHTPIHILVPRTTLDRTGPEANWVPTPAGPVAISGLVTHPDTRARAFATTPGRLIFNLLLPEAFPYVAAAVHRGAMREIVAAIARQTGPARTAATLDAIMRCGFAYATRSGISLGVQDIVIPPGKDAALAAAQAELARHEDFYRRGLIAVAEWPAYRYAARVRAWTEANERVRGLVQEALPRTGPLYLMLASRAIKGDFAQVSQIAGMRGLLQNARGETIDIPITSNFREGLSMIEYVTSVHGARKGLVDTATGTAKAGYLTRRVVDALQDVILSCEDCGTEEGLALAGVDIAGQTADAVAWRLVGRHLVASVRAAGSPALAQGTEVTEDLAARLAAGLLSGEIDRVVVRSPLACRARWGLCRRCYGWSMARRAPAPLGEAVGVIAGQSIGEPGTQLVLRTFHRGGIAGEDITQGLPRVDELVEARTPRARAILSAGDGTVEDHATDAGRVLVVSRERQTCAQIPVPAGYEVVVGDGTAVVRGTALCLPPRGGEPIRAQRDGIATVGPDGLILQYRERTQWVHPLPAAARLLVGAGQEVRAGDPLTEGAIDPGDLLALRGVMATGRYLVDEIQSVYRKNGVAIHDKHVEIVARQMLRFIQVEHAGDTDLVPEEILERGVLEEWNAAILAQGGVPARGRPVVLGVTRVALATASWLSAASFQGTITVLREAALAGAVDPVRGLKERAMTGRLMAAGTGLFADQSMMPGERNVTGPAQTTRDHCVA